jgi:hypothetical protein
VHSFPVELRSRWPAPPLCWLLFHVVFSKRLNLTLFSSPLLRSLGVIELTVALNFVFDQPEDRIIWDVGHQVRTPSCATSFCWKQHNSTVCLIETRTAISVCAFFYCY